VTLTEKSGYLDGAPWWRIFFIIKKCFLLSMIMLFSSSEPSVNNMLDGVDKSKEDLELMLLAPTMEGIAVTEL